VRRAAASAVMLGSWSGSVCRMTSSLGSGVSRVWLTRMWSISSAWPSKRRVNRCSAGDAVRQVPNPEPVAMVGGKAGGVELGAGWAVEDLGGGCGRRGRGCAVPAVAGGGDAGRIYLAGGPGAGPVRRLRHHPWSPGGWGASPAAWNCPPHVPHSDGGRVTRPASSTAGGSSRR